MFNKACLLVLSGLFPLIAAAQSSPSATVVNSRQEMVIKPRFRGNLNEYITRNVKYPETAKENGLQGKCVIEFMVDEKGAIQRINKLQSSGSPVLDAEAERLIASMPTWRPGTADKQPIAAYYTLPINFELH